MHEIKTIGQHYVYIWPSDWCHQVNLYSQGWPYTLSRSPPSWCMLILSAWIDIIGNIYMVPNYIFMISVGIWWRHQMETFSALLAICAGNSPVPGEFPTQRPVTQSFDVYFDLRPNKRLSKQLWGWWFETPSCSLWRQCDEFRKYNLQTTPDNPLCFYRCWRWVKTFVAK